MPGGGPLYSLRILQLNANKLEDTGVEILARALAEGACPELQQLGRYVGKGERTDLVLVEKAQEG